MPKKSICATTRSTSTAIVQTPPSSPPSGKVAMLGPPMGNTLGSNLIHAIRIMKRTTAEPSLRSDSPSIIVPSFASVPRSLSSATTATGSVAERIVPRSQHALKFQWVKSSWMKPPVMSEATTTPGIAIVTICHSCFRKMAYSMSKADSKSSVGRKMTSITWGSMLPRDSTTDEPRLQYGIHSSSGVSLVSFRPWLYCVCIFVWRPGLFRS